MSAATQAVVELSLDEFDSLATQFAVDSWPPVLELAGAGCRSDAGPSSTVADWVISAIGVLAAPDAYIEIRSVTPDLTVRACVARGSAGQVLATRSPDRITLQHMGIDPVAELSSPICQVIGDTRAAGFAAFSVPSDELVETLGYESSGVPTHRAVADALRSFGAPAIDASVAAAFVESRRRTEICMVVGGTGRPVRSAANLAVFDTAHGRVLAAPSTASDGRVWLTFMPGTGHRIGQALCLLAETLPDTIGTS